MNVINRFKPQFDSLRTNYNHKKQSQIYKLLVPEQLPALSTLELKEDVKPVIDRFTALESDSAKQVSMLKEKVSAAKNLAKQECLQLLQEVTNAHVEQFALLGERMGTRADAIAEMDALKKHYEALRSKLTEEKNQLKEQAAINDISKRIVLVNKFTAFITITDDVKNHLFSLDGLRQQLKKLFVKDSLVNPVMIELVDIYPNLN